MSLLDIPWALAEQAPGFIGVSTSVDLIDRQASV